MPPKRTPAASQRPAKRDTRTVKRRRAVDEDESNNSPKALRRAQHTEARAAPDKKAFIEDWLEESCWSRRASPENEAQLLEVSANMHRKPAPVSSSPGNTFESPVSTSRKSEKSTTSVYVSDYRVSLSYRSIFVERENPPPELMRRAQRLISRS
ncbi:hypothetical protein PV05_03241 [Exophiala xenobiotica]|uniref:Uncharacterized protein n=1 Tax=Exophiala xenobiotica TaxID=348802 RepID=A0A0D2ESN7_9EURO|nr:uncharacterized protein PV05_03241 [Exophiala xenobiotica]KIW58743.1 hypothetical protein PV05_03241 [Exophiala xenobiotica]